jgi:hypothetical protein
MTALAMGRCSTSRASPSITPLILLATNSIGSGVPIPTSKPSSKTLFPA